MHPLFRRSVQAEHSLARFGAFSERTLELLNAIGGDFYDLRLEILVRLRLTRPPVERPQPARSIPSAAVYAGARRALDGPGQQRHRGGRAPCLRPHTVVLRADLLRAETETLRLTATVLCWLFTSSNRSIRDKATKALMAVITAQPAVYPHLLRQFVDVDDLYVGERVCAAGFGRSVEALATRSCERSRRQSTAPSSFPRRRR